MKLWLRRTPDFLLNFTNCSLHFNNFVSGHKRKSNDTSADFLSGEEKLFRQHDDIFQDLLAGSLGEQRSRKRRRNCN